jgi:hypothetical protein
MPKNKQESFVYGFIMCFMMVLLMSIYNMIWQMGWTLEVLPEAWLGLPLGFIVAFAIDNLIVGTPAKAFAHKYLIKKDSSHMRRVLSISLSIVVPMVIFMSLYGAIMAWSHGAQAPIFLLWGVNILRGFPAAVIFNLLIAGPLARIAFGWIFRKKEKQLAKLAEEDA